MNKYKNVRINGKTIGQHRLIMESILGRKLGRKECVHHINGNTIDNRADNLKVMSLEEHSRYHNLGSVRGPTKEKTKQLLAKASSGERNWNSRLTRSNVIKIRKLIAIGVTGRKIASMFGVGDKCISDIKLRKRWAHIA